MKGGGRGTGDGAEAGLRGDSRGVEVGEPGAPPEGPQGRWRTLRRTGRAASTSERDRCGPYSRARPTRPLQQARPDPVSTAEPAQSASTAGPGAVPRLRLWTQLVAAETTAIGQVQARAQEGAPLAPWHAHLQEWESGSRQGSRVRVGVWVGVWVRIRIRVRVRVWVRVGVRVGVRVRVRVRIGVRVWVRVRVRIWVRVGGAEGQGGSPGPGPGGSVNLAAAGLKSGWNPRGTAVGGDPGGGAWAREGQAPPPRPPSPPQALPSPAHSAHLPEVAQSPLLSFPRVAAARGRRSLVPLSRGHTGPGPPGGPVERSRLTSAGTGGAAETAEARGGGPGSLAPSGGRSRRGATTPRCARLRALGTALGPAGGWRGRGGVVIRREAGEGPASVHPEAQHHQVPASLLYTARVGF